MLTTYKTIDEFSEALSNRYFETLEILIKKIPEPDFTKVMKALDKETDEIHEAYRYNREYNPPLPLTSLLTQHLSAKQLRTVLRWWDMQVVFQREKAKMWRYFAQQRKKHQGVWISKAKKGDKVPPAQLSKKLGTIAPSDPWIPVMCRKSTI